MSELFVQAMDDEYKQPHMTVGVNGSAVYTPEGVGNHLLVLFNSLVRGTADSDLLEMVRKIPDSEFTDLALLTFYTRDILEGNGERRLFYVLFQELHRRNPDKAKKLYTLIPHYGAWFDMYRMFDNTTRTCRQFEPVAVTNPMAEDFAQIFLDRLLEDHAKEGAQVSLAGKWAPREGHRYHWFCKMMVSKIKSDESLSGKYRMYRKMIADLNTRLKTVETYMCADASGATRFSEIDFKRVPSLAMKKYRDAFLRSIKDNNDREQCASKFLEYLHQVEGGQAKIHGKLVYPHEFVQDIMKHSDDEDRLRVIEAQWQDLVSSIRQKGSLKGTVIMADFSGSMSMTHGSRVQPLYVAMGLAALCSQAAMDHFHGRFLTFDSIPEWHNVLETSKLKDIVDSMRGVSQGLNTNMEAAMDLILQTLQKVQAPAGEEPKQIVVITDMGWDQAMNNGGMWTTHFERLREQWKAAGYTLPRVIVWNVSCAFKEYHNTATEKGVVNISGWNANLLKMFLDGDDIEKKLDNPVFAMMSILRSERYQPIVNALADE